MRLYQVSLLTLCFIFLCSFCLFADDQPTTNDQFMAGVATADISPPVGVPLAGYGGGKRRLPFPDFEPDNYHTFLAPSEGVLDPLITKVVVLKSGDTKIAIIKLDSIGVTQDMVDDLAKRIQPATGIDRDHITASGTHTHSGPGAMGHSIFWAVAAADLFEEKVYEPFMQKLAALVIKADKNLQPASLGTGQSLVYNLSRNRRDHPGVIDPAMSIFRIDKMDGTPMAVVFNFAVHGTCYGSSNMKMSGDVMGVAERHIEKIMKEQKTPVAALFINGTEGDVSPNGGKAKGAKMVGEGMGNLVVKTLPTLTTHRNVKLGVANTKLAFKKAHLNLDLSDGRKREVEINCYDIPRLLRFLKIDPGYKLKIEVTGLVPMSFRLQAIRIGDTVIACIPGEPITNIGTMLKKVGGKTGFKETLIFGLSNGHMGYVCDKENFDEGGYEVMLNLYGRDEGDKIVNTFAELFKELAD